MQQYDLETNILACLLLEPDLMKKLKFEDKHFTKRQRLWQFMKAFYDKYQTFDPVLMYNACKNKYSIMTHLEALLDTPALPAMFDVYQEELIEEYNQSEIDKAYISQVYENATNLLVGSITIDDFEVRLAKLSKGRNEYIEGKNKHMEDSLD